MMPVTEHAVKRVRQRLGIPRKAMPKEAARAWDRGERRSAFKGNRGSWLSQTASEYPKSTLRIYRGFLWVFVKRSRKVITITPLPAWFNGAREKEMNDAEMV